MRPEDVALRVVDLASSDIRELYERALVLVRPDGHVAWRNERMPEDTLRLVDVVRGAAEAPNLAEESVEWVERERNPSLL